MHAAGNVNFTADVNEPTYIQEEEANHDSPRRKIRRRENSTEL